MVYYQFTNAKTIKAGFLPKSFQYVLFIEFERPTLAFRGNFDQAKRKKDQRHELRYAHRSFQKDHHQGLY